MKQAHTLSDKKNRQKYVFDTTVGSNKTENQDNIIIIENQEYVLYGVFDGVGSAVNGKLSTEIAVEYIKDNYKIYTENVHALDRMMFNCNKHILSRKIKDPFSTYCIAIVPNDVNKSVTVSSLGDSRIYIVTSQYIEQITTDDRVYYGRNMISRCLGMELSFENFTQKKLTRFNSSLLLCTDGFYDIFEQNRLKFFESFLNQNLKAIANEIRSYMEGMNSDDATYIFVK